MEKTKKIGWALMMLMLPATQGLFAQTSFGEIQGKVFETKDVPPVAAMVWVDMGGGNLLKSMVDDDGRYSLKPLEPGSYTMFLKVDMDTFRFPVAVNSNEITRNTTIDLSSPEIAEMKSTVIGDTVTIIHWRDPLIRVEGASMEIVRAKELKHSPAKRDVKQIIASMTSGVKVTENGDAYVRGSRADAINYYVDGMRMRDGFKSPPASALASVAIYTGGVPAKYGDCTGGVVVVETQSYFNLYQEWKLQQQNGNR